MRPLHLLTSAGCGALLCGAASAADLVVDATGAVSPYTTIEAAMVASSPGDRILVLPGSYPAFHFSRGVAVIGMGASPDAVRIARVDYHPNVPPFGYETSLSNVSICGSGPADTMSISGNELALGTLTLHGVETCGGVFLHGDEGFSVLVVDSAVDPGPGHGFLGAAFDFAGGTLDVVTSRIAGWDASPVDGVPAGGGLRVGAGVEVTVTASLVTGGDGDPDGPSFEPGGDGLAAALGATGVHAVLAGDSTVHGGAGAGAGAGGDGVALYGTIELGTSDVQGGAGAPAGAAFPLDPPAVLGYDPELRVTPSAPFSSAPVALRPGELVTATLDASLPETVAIGFSFGVSPPAGPIATLLDGPMTLVFAPSVSLVVPSAGGTLPGLQAFAQGFFVDPATLAVRSTNPVTVRMDL